MTTDGLTIARQRIARETEEKTGFLDLGRLGLSAVPVELLALTHLHRLNLGRAYSDERGQWHESEPELEANSVAGNLGPLADLPVLESLWLVGTDLEDARELAPIANLQSLSCSYTQVSGVAPLKD